MFLIRHHFQSDLLLLCLTVWRYVFVADFEALSYQVTTTFDTGCAARIPTTPAINYTACCALHEQSPPAEKLYKNFKNTNNFLKNQVSR
jgi:hypothetical protein